MVCDFVEQLKKLRKSSIESIEDGNSDVFDPFKKYLHIERDIERDLKKIILSTNQANQKSLVLICGSAGDGKSHLLSMLKNNDEKLLENYIIHNDATESFSPEKSATQTLNDVLIDFSDSNIANDSSIKLIVAINLGTLNNFIESKFGQNFNKLKEFVNRRNILSGDTGVQNYVENSYFQSISFGDFNNYSLTETGVEVDFIVELIKKITASTESNIFFNIYNENNYCHNEKRCPVRHNYKLLQNQQVQKNVALKLVEMSIKDKYFLSTRECLDYIYNIIVHTEFESGSIFLYTNDSEFFAKYLEYTLPTLMFESKDISPISNLILKYDHLKLRNQDLDEELLSFNVSNNIDEICNEILVSTSYKNVVKKENIAPFMKNNNDMKTTIFKFISRVKCLTTDTNTTDAYQEFLKYLYYYNKGCTKELLGLYEMVRKSIFCWNGSVDKNCIRINDSKNIKLFAKLELEESLVYKELNHDEELHKFENNIRVMFKQKGVVNSNVRQIRIDYALYLMIYNINNGYLPNAQDKQHYIEFYSFVTSLYDLSNAKTKVYTIDSENRKGIFELTPFGYEFKVI